MRGEKDNVESLSTTLVWDRKLRNFVDIKFIVYWKLGPVKYNVRMEKGLRKRRVA